MHFENCTQHILYSQGPKVNKINPMMIKTVMFMIMMIILTRMIRMIRTYIHLVSQVLGESKQLKEINIRRFNLKLQKYCKQK